MTVEEPKVSIRKSELTDRNVHVWAVRTEAPPNIILQFEKLLAADEQERAARFRFDHLRAGYTLARGALRLLLAQYLAAPADRIEFSYGPKGKPALVSRPPVQFNLSHSGALAVYAFAFRREVGIDVEAIRPMPDMAEVAGRFFCPEEAEELLSLPPEQRPAGFFNCWTRKEAYIKAIGEGLFVPLDRFRVTLRPGDPARFVHLEHDPEAARVWNLHDLKPDSHYAAALAYQGARLPVEFFSPIVPAQLLELA